MNRNILLIAAREFRQIAKTRSFWLTLLILPLMFAAIPMITRFVDPSFEQRVMLIDRSQTGAGKAVADRLAFEEQRANLAALADFARANDLTKLAPDAVWTHRTGWYADGAVARFIAQGGAQAARKTIAAHDPKLAGTLKLPKPNYEIMAVPEAVARAPYDQLDAALKPYLQPGKEAKRKPVDYVLAIPPDFGTQPAVRLWSSGQPRGAFMALLQGELTRTLRTGYLAANGVAPPVAQIANMLEPAIAITRPQEVGGREKVIIQSLLPVAMTYILLMSLFMSGNWMLQSTIEERSSKLIEAVLACASPNDLMVGKLLGTMGIGMVMVLSWFACGLFAGFATHGVIADFIRPAMEPISSPGTVLAILFFFLAGYVMVSMIFLTIGAMSDSMQDAQGMLVPTLLIVMLPVMVLIQVIITGSNSVLVKILTWVPLITPFAVLARLGSGISVLEMVGSGVVLVAFIGVELVLLGRVFRASLLGASGRPSFKAIGRLIRQG